MNRLRTILVCAMLALTALGSAGCAAGGLTGVGLFAASHTKLARQHPRLMQSVWCGYHVWRLEHDVRTRHLGWAAFQTVMSAHHCSRAIRGR